MDETTQKDKEDRQQTLEREKEMEETFVDPNRRNQFNPDGPRAYLP